MIKSVEEERGRPLPFLLAGTCIDHADERQVSTKQGNALAEEFHAPFIEISSKTGENLQSKSRKKTKTKTKTVRNQRLHQKRSSVLSNESMVRNQNKTQALAHFL